MLFDDTLVAVAAYGLPGAQVNFRSEPLDHSSWTNLIQQVRSQRLIGLLAAAVYTGDLAVTDEQRAEVVEDHVGAMSLVLTLEHALLLTQDLLETAGIPCLVLKGSAVAHLDYEDPCLRQFGDVDVMVPSLRFDDAIHVLTKAGYERRFPAPHAGFDRRFGKGATLLTPDGHELDLHRTFVMGPLGLTVDLDDVWSESTSFVVGGRLLRALSPEARLLNACYHALLGNRPSRLLPHRDVAEMLLLGSYDESCLRSLATRWQANAVLAQAISSTWQTLHLADVTALSTWAARYRADAREHRLISVYTDRNTSYAAMSVAALSVIPSFTERCAFLRSLAFPDRGFLAQRGGTRAHWLMRGLGRAMRDRKVSE
jgi:hypothetical protein